MVLCVSCVGARSCLSRRRRRRERCSQWLPQPDRLQRLGDAAFMVCFAATAEEAWRLNLTGVGRAWWSFWAEELGSAWLLY